MSEQVHIDWDEIREKAGPYPQAAYQFVRDGLAHTVRVIHGEGAPVTDAHPDHRHVTGQQLCMGLRDFAIHQYGMLARTVLDRWHIRRTDDFGRMVFAMIDAGLMRKSDQDTFEDFCGVFEFDEGFPSEPG